MGSVSRAWPGLFGAATICVIGCGSDGVIRLGDASAPTLDAGTPPPMEALPDGALVVAPPEPPEATLAPRWTPCPAGFQIAGGDADQAPVTCRPIPTDPVPECAEDEAPWPGTSGCARVGAPCPLDVWPTLPDSGATLHVLAGAAPGGDGSRDMPFGTVAEAVGIASDGTTILLSAGRFAGPVDLPAGVALRGACTAQTIVTGDDRGATITLGRDTEVADLRVEGGSPAIAIGEGTATVRLQRVVVTDADAAAVALAPMSALVASDLVVRRAQGNALTVTGAALSAERFLAGGCGGSAVRASGPGTDVRLRDIVAVDNGGGAVEVDAGGRVEAERVVALAQAGATFAATEGAALIVRDALSGHLLEPGRAAGIVVGTGASFEGERMELVGHGPDAARASDTGTRLALTDATIQRSQGPTDAPLGGRGVRVLRGARVALTRVELHEGHEAGIIADGMGTEMELSHVRIHRVRPDAFIGLRGWGIVVRAGAHLRADHLHVESVFETGLRVRGPDSQAVVVDGVLSDVSADATGDLGRGLEVLEDARAELRRVRIEGGAQVGVLVAMGGSLFVESTQVLDTVGTPLGGDGEDRALGRGVEVQDGSVEGNRVALERNRDVGLFVFGSSTLTLEDLAVRDTRPGAAGAFGRGLVALGGASVTLARSRFARNRDVTLFAAGADTRVVATDLVVTDTDSEATGGTLGRAINLQDGAVGELTGVYLSGNREAAVAAFGADVFLERLVITETGPQRCSLPGWLEERPGAIPCPESPGGIGIGAYMGGYASVRSFEVSHSFLAGIQLAYGQFLDGDFASEGGAADLFSGLVAHNSIGANVQTEGFELGRLLPGVVYRDNRRNMDVSYLPVPPLGVTDLEDPRASEP